MAHGQGAFETAGPRVVWLAAAILAAPCLIVLGQGAALPVDDEDVRRHGIFLDSLDVSLINVEVHVSRGGEPVTDLGAGDFEVLDDGEPVEVTNFFRVEGGRRQGGEEPPADSEFPVGAAPSPAGSITEPSTVVVLVDHAFIAPRSRQVVFDKLSERLERLLSAGTQVMVVSKDRDVEIALPLTSRRADVDAALEGLAKVATSSYATDVRSAIQSVDEGHTAAQSGQSGPGAQSPSGALGTAEIDARGAFQDARAHSERLFGELRTSIGLLHRFLGSLSGLPGRKAVLYVADRLPVRAGELVWRIWFEKYGFDYGTRFGTPSVEAALKEYDATRLIQDLIADANTSRIAFYPIGVGSDAGPNLLSVENRSLSNPNRMFTQVRESDDGLRWLAEGTGGQVALGRGAVDRFFDGLRRDLTGYYSLAYASPHRGDGETHRVEIRVPGRDDLEVRYLTEYRDKSEDQRMAERTLSALTLGLGQNPLEVRVELGDSRKNKKEDRFAVPMEVRVPVANLVLLPEKKAHMGKVTIQLIVRDEKGRTSDPVRIRMPIEIPHAGILQALSESAIYKTELTMRRGRQRIAVGVRDEFGSVSSTVNVDFDVGGGR